MTIAELKCLRNTRYHDRPASLYGGMVELPLIVTRDEDAAWFSGAEPLTDGRLWADRDARLRGETARLERELREDLLGRAVWDALEPATRGFLASGEAVLRAHRDDPGFDFSGPAIEYDLLPYDESTRHQVDFRYGVGIRALSCPSTTMRNSSPVFPRRPNASTMPAGSASGSNPLA